MLYLSVDPSDPRTHQLACQLAEISLPVMSNETKHNQPWHPGLFHFKVNQNRTQASNDIISSIPTDKLITLVSRMTCSLQANHNDQLSTNPQWHHNAHTLKVQPSISSLRSHIRNCFVYVSLLDVWGFRWSSDNDEVNIIECLVFINATAETGRQRRWGGEKGSRRWVRQMRKRDRKGVRNGAVENLISITPDFFYCV